MLRFAAVSTFILALSSVTALADEPYAGVFVSDPAQCKAVAENGAQAVFDGDFTILTLADGVLGNEFTCHFADIKPAADGQILVITAMCEEPGLQYPDLLSLSVYDDERVQLNSLYLASAAGGVGDTLPGQTLYSRCDNLSELPLVD